MQFGKREASILFKKENHGRKKVIQNDMKVNKWWQNLNFKVKYYFRRHSIWSAGQKAGSRHEEERHSCDSMLDREGKLICKLSVRLREWGNMKLKCARPSRRAGTAFFLASAKYNSRPRCTEHLISVCSVWQNVLEKESESALGSTKWFVLMVFRLYWKSRGLAQQKQAALVHLLEEHWKIGVVHQGDARCFVLEGETFCQYKMLFFSLHFWEACQPYGHTVRTAS